MAITTVSKCAECGYPLNAVYEGETISCPMCSTLNEAITQGVTIPTPVFVGVLAFAAGMIVGPALIATTSEGRSWLERQARGAIRK